MGKKTLEEYVAEVKAHEMQGKGHLVEHLPEYGYYSGYLKCTKCDQRWEPGDALCEKIMVVVRTPKPRYERELNI